MEIYIFGAGGHEIMNIKSDDNAAIESLYDLAVSGIAINLYWGALKKIYGPPSKQLNPGMTIEEVADILERNGFGKEKR